MTTDVAARATSTALISRFDSLIAATDAYKNGKAMLLLGLTLFASGLCSVLLGLLASSVGALWIAGLGGLLAVAILFYGMNAVGILIMHEAQGKTSHAIMDAVLLSVFTGHRLIGVMFLEAVIVLLALGVVAVVLFICKMPVIGPLLFTFVFPVTAILLGALVFSLFYVMFPLAGPAVWAGCTVFQVVARLNVIARKKLVSVILSQLLLLVIVGFASSVIFLVVGTGLGLITGLSASILGTGGVDISMLLMGLGGGMRGDGHMIAGAIGGGLLFAAAIVIPMLMLAKGFCVIYLNATGDLDFSQAEGELESRIESVKKKAEEAREHARALAEKQRGAITQPADMPAVAPQFAAPQPEVAKSCSSCRAPLVPGDVFCGECGAKVM